MSGKHAHLFVHEIMDYEYRKGFKDFWKLMRFEYCHSAESMPAFQAFLVRAYKVLFHALKIF
ncbi:MAG: hypothetical protein CMQ45_03315 [Gammaproteobacteria bacterium]|nr:hypothetical protein [Gammaproteobacteria bacterium]|tara:strand:+ start:68 stop:253 length:186 start_codon:yes stop_codon:yes gene_type:complete